MTVLSGAEGKGNAKSPAVARRSGGDYSSPMRRRSVKHSGGPDKAAAVQAQRLCSSAGRQTAAAQTTGLGLRLSWFVLFFFFFLKGQGFGN